MLAYSAISSAPTRAAAAVRIGGRAAAKTRSKPAPIATASASIARIMKREGTRMKFIPGSAYKCGHSPSGVGRNSQTASNASKT